MGLCEIPGNELSAKRVRNEPDYMEFSQRSRASRVRIGEAHQVAHIPTAEPGSSSMDVSTTAERATTPLRRQDDQRDDRQVNAEETLQDSPIAARSAMGSTITSSVRPETGHFCAINRAISNVDEALRLIAAVGDPHDTVITGGLKSARAQLCTTRAQVEALDSVDWQMQLLKDDNERRGNLVAAQKELIDRQNEVIERVGRSELASREYRVNSGNSGRKEGSGDGRGGERPRTLLAAAPEAARSSTADPAASQSDSENGDDDELLQPSFHTSDSSTSRPVQALKTRMDGGLGIFDETHEGRARGILWDYLKQHAHLSAPPDVVFDEDQADPQITFVLGGARQDGFRIGQITRVVYVQRVQMEPLPTAKPPLVRSIIAIAGSQNGRGGRLAANPELKIVFRHTLYHHRRTGLQRQMDDYLWHTIDQRNVLACTPPPGLSHPTIKILVRLGYICDQNVFFKSRLPDNSSDDSREHAGSKSPAYKCIRAKSFAAAMFIQKHQQAMAEHFSWTWD